MASDDSGIDALFSLPLGEFTKRRNALAAKLAKAGNEDASAEVKALEKPSISAWAVNQIARREKAAVKALLAQGERARAAQSKALAGGDAAALRERVEELRASLLRLRGKAADILKAAGHAASDETLERVTTSLRTAAQAPEAGDILVAGRLTEDLDPLGLAVLSAPRPAAKRAGREAEAPRAESIRERRARIAAGLRAGGRGEAVERKERRERERTEAAERRQREHAESQRRRKLEATAAAARAALQKAEAADAAARKALEAAEEALEVAQRGVETAREEREETLRDARAAREALDSAEAALRS